MRCFEAVLSRGLWKLCRLLETRDCSWIGTPIFCRSLAGVNGVCACRGINLDCHFGWLSRRFSRQSRYRPNKSSRPHPFGSIEWVAHFCYICGRSSCLFSWIYWAYNPNLILISRWRTSVNYCMSSYWFEFVWFRSHFYLVLCCSGIPFTKCSWTC